MNKNIRIIDVNGIMGLLLFMFILMCLGVGFIVFPGFLFMAIWNFVSEMTFMIPEINFLQGEILWAIIFISFCLLTNNKVMVTMVNRKFKK